MPLHHKRTIVTPKCSNFNMQLQFRCISEHHGFKFDNNEKPSNNRYVVVQSIDSKTCYYSDVGMQKQINYNAD